MIELDDPADGARWVVADWGLTRRPLGETTERVTKTGEFVGTEGFAPPEAYLDAHSSGPLGDIYSLGQVIAWAVGVDPVPNMVPNVKDPWRSVVAPMTRLAESERIGTINEVRELVASLSADLDGL